MVRFVLGDARCVSSFVDVGSVDLVVTSPPYFSLRDYQDGGGSVVGQVGLEGSPEEFVDVLVGCVRDWLGVLRPSGSLWVNLGDKYSGSGGYNNQGLGAGGRGPVSYSKVSGGVPRKSLLGLPWRFALRCVDELGLVLRAEVVWSKPNGLPESVSDRVRRSHEHWFHFSVSQNYFSSMDAIREPHKEVWESRPTPPARARQGAAPLPTRDAPPATPHPLGKIPDSVWTIPTEPFVAPDHLGVDHYAAFPSEFPRRIILGWCPEGGTVLDPFGGTGTTAAVANLLGRDAIHVDISEDYLRLAEWRVYHDTALHKRVLERTGLSTAHLRQVDGQTTLFDM